MTSDQTAYAWLICGVRIILLMVILVGAALSLLPLLPLNAWWVRVLDFRRLQFALGTAG